MQDLFIELLQVSLCTRNGLSRVPTAVEWQGIFDEALRQAVAGILVCGIERLPKEQQPAQGQLLEWIGTTLQIEQRNKLTTAVCQKLCEQFEKDGYWVCVLKGQANHRYYPREMRNRRNCGDVDLWVCPMSDVRGKKKDVKRTLEYVDAHFERDGLCWLHCNFTDKSSVPVEVHFHPSFFSRPKYNRRFQKHFADIVGCLEIEGFSHKRPSDDQVWLQIKELTGATCCTAFQKLPDEKKRSVLRRLKDDGASHRQL